MGKVVGILMGLVVAGATGYFYSNQQTTQVTNTLEQTQQELDRVRHREALAMVTVEAGRVLVDMEQKNFAVAREQSTKFFDTVQGMQRSAIDAKEKQTLTDIMAARDEVTSDLATGSDHSVPRLREMHLSLQQLLQ